MPGSEMNEEEKKELIRETMKFLQRLRELEAKHTLFLERVKIRLGIDIRKLINKGMRPEELFEKIEKTLDSVKEQKPFFTNFMLEDLRVMAEIVEFKKQIGENFRRLRTQPKGFDPRDFEFFKTSL